MKSTLLIFLILLMPSISSAQSEDVEQLVRLFKKPGVTIAEVWRPLGVIYRGGDSLEFIPGITPIFSFQRLFTVGSGHTILDTYRLHSFYIWIDAGRYRIPIITEGDRIISAAIVREDVFWDRLSRDSMVCTMEINPIRLHDLLRAYGKKYGIPINLDDDVLSPYLEIVYGWSCGFVSRTPAPCKEMFGLLRTSDTTSLRLWLRSMNREIQAYGATGLLMLDSLGTPIAPADRAVIDELIAMNDTLFACSGCTYGVDFTTSEALSPESISRMLREYRGFELLGPPVRKRKRQ